MKRYLLPKGTHYGIEFGGQYSPLKTGADNWKTAQSKAKALALYKREIALFWGYPIRSIVLSQSDIKEVSKNG